MPAKKERHTVKRYLNGQSLGWRPGRNGKHPGAPGDKTTEHPRAQKEQPHKRPGGPNRRETHRARTERQVSPRPNKGRFELFRSVIGSSPDLCGSGPCLLKQAKKGVGLPLCGRPKGSPVWLLAGKECGPRPGWRRILLVRVGVTTPLSRPRCPCKWVEWQNALCVVAWT